MNPLTFVGILIMAMGLVLEKTREEAEKLHDKIFAKSKSIN